AGHLGADRGGPGGPYPDQDWPGQARHSPRCSLCKSDWIAFLPSSSHWPIPSTSTFWWSALATYAGEPGTVERIELLSVVMLPSGPRYGCIVQSILPSTLSVPAPSLISCSIFAL